MDSKLPSKINMTTDPDESVGSHRTASIRMGEIVGDEKNLSRDAEAWAADPRFASIDQKRILRKMDIRLIPMLAVLFLLSFLDRGNIGNAKIQGMIIDLKMTGQEFSWTLTVFFLSYCVFEIPSNILLKRLRPSIWLPSLMVAWGIVVTLMGVVKNFEGLLIARLFLGVSEGGLYPGVVFYITMWYSPSDAQYRQALFFSAASAAGAFSGLLAFAISKMDGIAGVAGWRWIFIIEGILTVVIAVSSFFLMYDFPDTAPFLTEVERAWVVERLQYQGSKGSTYRVTLNEKFQWKYVKDAFTDWQVLTAMFMNLGLLGPLYGTSLFLPTIINDLGYTNSDAQLLTIPMYVTAALMAVVVAWYSDRHGQRSPFIFFFICWAAIGFAITICGAATGYHGMSYAGVFIAITGMYTAFPGNITWISNNVSGNYKRSVALAIHVGFGNLAGAMSSNFYRAQDSPKYIIGHSLSLFFLLIALTAALTLRFGYQHANKKRDREGVPPNMTEEEMSAMGDKAPNFRYLL